MAARAERYVVEPSQLDAGEWIIWDTGACELVRGPTSRGTFLVYELARDLAWRLNHGR